MAININASTSAGFEVTPDNSGNLNIQSGGSTKIAVTSAGVAVTGLSKASLPTGSVLQVVSATYSVGVSNSSTTFIDTGLTATITPTSATSKILVIVNQNEILKNTSNTSIGLRLLRDSTTILNFTRYASATLDTSGVITQAGATYLDSPATTSATTYKTQFSNSSGTATATVQFGNEGNSTITLMEIAA